MVRGERVDAQAACLARIDCGKKNDMTVLSEQLTKYLTDAHSIEQQALVQMRVAPELAADPQLAEAFTRHCHETLDHERAVRERLADRGASPAKIKDLLGTLTGKGFAAFARAQPDTPGKLVAHGFSYEHMELAAYEMLAHVAELAGDEESVAMARRIAAQEDAMAERLGASFDRAVDASLREVAEEDLGGRLDSYLTDVHAIEAQSLQLLAKATDLAGVEQLAKAYAEHRCETEHQQRRVADLLQERDSSPSRLKDAAMRLGALNWGAFFQAQPDTPAKLAAFAYAFEHLEIAAYELLARVARRAGETAAEQLATETLIEERAAAARLHALFVPALEASLPKAGA
jgi:ferritin-like metal-binding protein YciE